MYKNPLYPHHLVDVDLRDEQGKLIKTIQVLVRSRRTKNAISLNPSKDVLAILDQFPQWNRSADLLPY